MTSGARPGGPTWLRRVAARALAHDLAAFVVPDPDMLAALGLDLRPTGVRVAANPRHATVLLLVGSIPAGLATAAATVYAQMPRPRAILVVGGDRVPTLPAPDCVTTLTQEDLASGVARLRHLLANGAWSQHAEPLAAPGGSRSTRGGDPDPTVPHGSMGHAATVPVPTPPGTDANHRPDASTRPAHGAHGGSEVEHSPVASDATETLRGGMESQGHQVPPSADHAPARHGGAAEHAHDPEAGSSPHVDVGQPHHERNQPADVAVLASMPEMDHGPPVTAGSSPGPLAGSHASVAEATEGGAEDPNGMAQMADTGMSGMHHGDIGAMEHGSTDGGFMSMVMMTEGLPRSADGLPMEWSEVPFGPLFPGLPAGLALTLTLDGDTVVKTAVGSGTVARGCEATWPGPVRGFPERLARLEPFAASAYRFLAVRAVDAAGGGCERPDDRARWMGQLELERAASHLLWLARFIRLLGDARLADQVVQLQLALRRSGSRSLADVQSRARTLADRLQRSQPLAARLKGVGHINDAGVSEVGGPVARAAGRATDARGDEALYQAVNFAPITRTGNDALARLWVRLDEIEQSLDLALGARTLSSPELSVDALVSGTGTATVETPRGAATLTVTLADGTVTAATLSSPSDQLLRLIGPVAEGHELADALLGIASLDLSPWEADR